RRAAQTNPPEHLRDARREVGAAQAAEPAGQLEQLAAAHPGVETWVLVEVAEPAVKIGPVEAGLDAGDRGRAAGRHGQPGEDPDRRRLAGAVGAEEPEHRSRR